MKLFKIGNTDVKCSPLLLPALIFSVAAGRASIFAVALLSLAVHEAAHAMAAHRLGFAVDSVEIQPFGFVARIAMEDALPGESAAVFAAGPVASLCMAAGSSLMESLVPVYASAGFCMTEFNLLIFAVNILPALPLDGGRLLLALLDGRRRGSAAKTLRISGVLTGAVFLGLFAFMLTKRAVNPTFLIMGVFLTIAALREKTELPVIKKKRLAGSYQVTQLAVPENERIIKAISQLPRGGYGVVSVLDGDMRRVAVIDETQLMTAAKVLGAGARLSEAVALYRGEMV